MYTAGCQEDLLQEQEAHSKITNTVLIMFFVCMLGVGIGMTAVSTLGIPFIDDNVASRESPIYIAITIGVRILGPAAGFILGSFCTRMYVDLTDPGLNTSDPKWVGAWYLGKSRFKYDYSAHLTKYSFLCIFRFGSDLVVDDFGFDRYVYVSKESKG